MARKEATITVVAEGRDKGKQFLLREMSASAAEAWAMKFFLALMSANVQIPDEVATAGLAGVAEFVGRGSIAGLKYEEVAPLMEQMMDCVQALPDPKHPEIKRSLVEDDTEEVATRLLLKSEVFKLHTGFSMADTLSRSAQVSAMKGAQS